MKIKSKLLIGLSLLAVTSAEAKVSLTTLWGDNMVIQRNEEVLFWGKSTGRNVEITPSWGDTVYRAKVAKDGSWSTVISTPDAGEGYTVSFDDGDKLTLENVLLGDVWLCLGQSNMKMPMSGYLGQPTEGAAQIISQAKPSRPIRMYSAAETPSTTEQSDNSGAWGCNTSETVSNFSATGYLFGSTIQQQSDIPIGLIYVGRGATSIEVWMSREWLSEVKEYDFSAMDRGEGPENIARSPCYLYNGMIAPLKGLTIRGAIWYQGEANIGNRDEYLKLFPTFVKGLRANLRGGEFPFYYAQIAPYASPDNATSRVLMRETMAKLMDITPRTGMATLTDVGESASIHPRYKREVGERLALWALCELYGVTGIEYRAPEYSKMEVVTNAKSKRREVIVTFDYTSKGVNFKDGIPSTLFEVAGEDRVFHPANAQLIHRNSKAVKVWCDEVAEPVAVRYAFKDYVKGDLYNNFGIPVSSFRTDDWEVE